MKVQDRPTHDRKQVHLIWAHPRQDSLTGRVVDGLKKSAKDLEVDLVELDLYREGFDPVLREVDEPDWNNPDKQYSPEVHALFESLSGSTAAVIVFPVWWFTVPAILKGYIDRVWNHGLSYGQGKKLPFSAIRWVALVGGSQSRFESTRRAEYMEHFLNESMAGYGGVTDSRVVFLYNTIAVEETTDNLLAHHDALIEQAREEFVSLVS